MLRMRALLAALVACALFGLASAQLPGDKVYTPPDGEWGEDMCVLMGIGFFAAGGATTRLSPEPAFKPAFAPNQYNYDLDCTAQVVGGKFTIQPIMADSGSSGEVTFNGVKTNFRIPDGTGISNLGKAPGSPRKWSFDLQWVKGVNTITIGVGCNGEGKPYPCYYTYSMKCTVGGGGGGVTGDPQFVGLRGQSYQVHGVAGEIYNIVSDPELQYNSRFVFLTSGACPIVDGVKQKACWSHPGSFLGELGLKTRAGDKIHLVSGSADDGFQSVSVNGKELAVGNTVVLAGDLGSVSRNSTHLAQVLVGNWDFAFENSDMFVNQRVRVLDARKLASHGLLGQTWRTATYPNAVKYIQGAVDDYVIRDKDIYGDAFLYNQFD